MIADGGGGDAVGGVERLDARLDATRRATARLVERRRLLAEDRSRAAARVEVLEARLARADAVREALERLTEGMFAGVLGVIAENVTIALREVLDQPLALAIDPTYHRAHGLRIAFSIDRGGDREDILHGQGGSVANVVAVGLRLFALCSLDEREHRPFLLLDEPDCWLRPDLVPRLVRLIREAADRLGVQTVLISHHRLDLFEQEAAAIHRLRLAEGRAEVERIARRRAESG